MFNRLRIWSSPNRRKIVALSDEFMNLDVAAYPEYVFVLDMIVYFLSRMIFVVRCNQASKSIQPKPTQATPSRPP
jgi:hypothetical protein